MARAFPALDRARRAIALTPRGRFAAIGPVAIIALLAASPVSAGTGWSDPELVTGLYSPASMVLDGNNKVHAAIAGGPGIAYVTNVTGVWQRTPVTTGPDYDPSVAIDGAGDIWIAYERHAEGPGQPYEPRAIHVAFKPAGGTTWTSGKIVGTIARDSSPSIRVRAGRLYVAFSRHHSGIWYATRRTDAASWTVSQAVSDTRIDNRLDFGETPTSLAVTSDGRPSIAYPRLGTGSRPQYIGIRLLRRTADGTWRTTMLATGPDYRPKLQVDDDDELHLLFGCRSRLWYLTTRGHVSGFGTPHKLDDIYTSEANLAIDHLGKAHVATQGGFGLMYYTNEGGRWALTEITDEWDSEPDIAVGTDGKVRVMFSRQLHTSGYGIYFTVRQ